MECVKRKSCPICNGPHHFSICFRNPHDDDLSPKGDTDNIVSAVFKTEVNSVLLQTCFALIDDKNEQEVVRLFLGNGSQRSFVLKSTSEKFNFPILRKENLFICTFGAKETETKTLNIVKIKLKNRDDPNLCIEIEVVETEHISITNLPTPDRNIDKKFRYLKNVQSADPYEFNDKEISILIGADYYYQVQLSEFWDLDNLGIEAEVSDEENIDNDIMSEFEAGISYQNKRVNPIAFVADIKMAFLMIEIDESERDFTRFFWDENPGIDLGKRLEIFRMTRVLFGLHCFSDASKKAYGTVAYLRIELNDGNIISSFVASKGRVAPLKTLSIPRWELMGALLSARLSDKIATALILPVSRSCWTDSSITCYWIKGDFNRHKGFVKNRIKEIQKVSDPKEWRYCKGKDNPTDLISRSLPLNDLKNNKIWWHGPKWLTMKQTEWSLFSEPTIETEINIDKLELKKSINVNTVDERR
ncbi:integrase catalytic domain-containing protein [Trichonephila clavipes]|uniref:Integrase catalytic domain-containing protein n=1 Tax=Trichonephila clavipes TaxID=2585209 RepID=A0A8X7BNJ4_TRICX|nr:integrase catalytic domain-containing protein [Trichonephila clavipes]